MIVGKKQGSKKVQLIFFIIFLCALLLAKVWQYHWPQESLVFAGERIDVHIAQTPWHWHRGLGKRASMEGMDGMLFVFPFAERHGFVMRDMQFPIDIVWINQGVVVDIAPSVMPEPGVAEADLRVYRPRAEATMVLELPAGWTAAHGVIIGDTLSAAQ